VRVHGIVLGTITASPWKNREKHRNFGCNTGTSGQELKPGPPTDTAGVSFTSCVLEQRNCLSLSPFKRTVLYVHEKNKAADLSFWKSFSFISCHQEVTD
jgi:hypothetical protein